MKYFCISEEQDVLTGLRLAGIDGVLARTPKEVAEAVEKACADPGVAVLLVTENCRDMYAEPIDELKLTSHRPLITYISGSKGSKRGSDSITRLINEAIGVKL